MTKRRRLESETGNSSASSVPADRPAEPGIRGYEYDVFLSFRGEDVRKNFADFLYTALVEAGVRVYRDNEELDMGEEVGRGLLQGIERSRICIPIFSENYASSKWCLKEFAFMMECRETRKQIVLPVFYDVTPGQVRHQSGSYGRAFRQHVKKQDPGTIQQWREALVRVGSLRGWQLANEASGHQGQLIMKKIVPKVLRELKTAHLITDELVGIETQVETVMRLLEVGDPDVRFIGICGMGGIGKTTLAKVIYNQILDQFESCSFLQDIRETSSESSSGLRRLQSQLVADLLRCDRRDFSSTDEGINELKRRFREKVVLILLDDVDHANQLNALAASCDWFARGSRIIVTARNRDVLKVPLGYRIYEVSELEGVQAVQLFCRHALRRDTPTAELEALSKEIVERTGGLPLALKVIGSFLCGKREDIWKATSQKLKIIPNKEVVNKLRISYDGLEHEQKQVFLDIACLFIGEDKTMVSFMWEDCFHYSPEAEIDVLLLASLIKIGEDNKMRMHDQLRDLGREIVRQENFREPGKRSRLWSNEAVDVLETHQGSRDTEAIRLNFGIGIEDYYFTPEQFQELANLRFLQLIGANLTGNFQNLLPKLRWLRWQISAVDHTVTNLNLKNLVILDLSLSRLTHDWTAWKSIQVAAAKLKVLDLSLCVELTCTPDFSKFRNLERLSLKYCLNLAVVDSSIGKLKRLTSLNMEGCRQIKELPEQVRYMKSLREFVIDGTSIEELPYLGDMKNLEILSARNCGCLSKVPDSIGQLTSLTDLILDETRITELPESIGSLVNLRQLTLAQTLLSRLPMSIGWLTSLVELVLTKTRVALLPDSIENLNNLEVLKIDHSLVQRLPMGLGKLERLQVIDASRCPLGGEIPVELGRLSRLKVLLLQRTKISAIPVTIKGLPLLEILDLAWCSELTTIPELPTSLVSVSATCQSAEPIPNLSDLINLTKLEFIRSTVPEEIVKLPKLEKLRIARTNNSILLDDIGMLSMLKELSIGYVTLQYLPKLPSSLRKLTISHCDSLKRLADLSNLQSLSDLRLKKCPQFVEIEGLRSLSSLRNLSISFCGVISTLDGLQKLESLTSLCVSGCANMKILPDLSKLRMLSKMRVSGCKHLVEIHGIGRLYALEDLDIRELSVERLSDLSNLKSLRWLRATSCEKLQAIDGLDELEKLTAVNISGCGMIERLSMSDLKLLQHVFADGCEKLQVIDGLDELENLLWLNIRGCKSIEKLPDLSSLKFLEYLHADGCEKLKGLDGLDKLEALVKLDISGCKAIQKMPDLSSLRLLEGLFADGCENLQELEGLGDLERVQRLSISGCIALENLPSLSKLKQLQCLDISGCKKLKAVHGLEQLELVEEIHISGCDLLQMLPDLPNARIIEDPIEDNHGNIPHLDEESDGLDESRGGESDDTDDSSGDEEQLDDLSDSADDEEQLDNLDDSSDDESHDQLDDASDED